MGLIYVGVLAVFGYGFYRQLVLGLPFGSKPMSDAGLVTTGILVIFILVISGWLLFGSYLHVEITDKGISYQFWPFFAKERHITPAQIVSHEVRTYKPIREFGGWGVRKGNSKTGDAYNVHGNEGLQLVLTSKKRILFGTQRPDAVTHAMKKLMEVNNE